MAVNTLVAFEMAYLFRPGTGSIRRSAEEEFGIRPALIAVALHPAANRLHLLGADAALIRDAQLLH